MVKQIELTQTSSDEFDYKTFFKNFHIIDGTHTRFEEKEVVMTHRGPVELIEYTECPECEHPVKANDPHRAEAVCEYCGLVLEHQILKADTNFFLGRSTENLPSTKGGLRKDEQKALDKKFINTDMQEWRINQYYLFASKAIKHFHMKSDQSFLVKSIINKYKIKEIHGCLNYEAVIIAVCMYILRHDGRLINYQEKFVRENGLNKVNYKVIKRNLDRLQVFK